MSWRRTLQHCIQQQYSSIPVAPFVKVQTLIRASVCACLQPKQALLPILAFASHACSNASGSGSGEQSHSFKRSRGSDHHLYTAMRQAIASPWGQPMKGEQLCCLRAHTHSVNQSIQSPICKQLLQQTQTHTPCQGGLWGMCNKRERTAAALAHTWLL